MKTVKEEEIPSRLNGGSGKKLVLPLNENGQIEWDKIRESTKERFATAVSTDEVALEAIGLAVGGDGSEGEESAERFSPQIAGVGLDILTKVNAFAFNLLVRRFNNHPFLKLSNGRPAPLVIEPDILAANFRVTPEAHENLDPKASKLLNKYAPAWMKFDNEWLDFGALYLFTIGGAAQNAISQQLKRDEARLADVRKRHEATRPAAPPEGFRTATQTEGSTVDEQPGIDL